MCPLKKLRIADGRSSNFAGLLTESWKNSGGLILQFLTKAIASLNTINGLLQSWAILS